MLVFIFAINILSNCVKTSYDDRLLLITGKTYKKRRKTIFLLKANNSPLYWELLKECMLRYYPSNLDPFQTNEE